MKQLFILSSFEQRRRRGVGTLVVLPERLRVILCRGLDGGGGQSAAAAVPDPGAEQAALSSSLSFYPLR